MVKKMELCSFLKLFICNKNTAKQINAYFTIEAALLLPMIMLFVTIVIFLSIYSYDRCIMEHSAYEAALSAVGVNITDTKEAAIIAENAAKKLIHGKLFAITDVSCSARADTKEITVTYSGSISCPFVSWIEEFTGKTDFTINVSRTTKRNNQARIIRTYRSINRMK